MTVILVSPGGDDVQVNGWNWRPTVNLFGKALGLDEEAVEKLQTGGIGASVSADQASEIAQFLDSYVQSLPRDSRVRLDGSVTEEPRSCAIDFVGTSNYSASYEWLIQFRDFCKTCGGFKVV
jgi:hypothetical protein